MTVAQLNKLVFLQYLLQNLYNQKNADLLFKWNGFVKFLSDY